MRGLVAATDQGWYQYLHARPHIEEVNFWRPGGGGFAALSPGEPFFFKLKAPYHAIGGFGQFARFAQLPVWMAWDVFGEANGVTDREALRARLAGIRREPALGLDHVIGCVSIAFPTFFAPDEWVALPADCPTILQGSKKYDLRQGQGQQLWGACVEQAVATHSVDPWTADAAERVRHGAPQVIEPRLGQASFRLAVLDAYGGACVVTTEHSLPVIEAAHIQPYSQGGVHEISNGLPLRRDLHRLFDLGFVTVRPNRRFAVSSELRDGWENGRVYYALEGKEIRMPEQTDDRPKPELLEWHGDVVFRSSS